MNPFDILLIVFGVPAFCIWLGVRAGKVAATPEGPTGNWKVTMNGKETYTLYQEHRYPQLFFWVETSWRYIGEFGSVSAAKEFARSRTKAVAAGDFEPFDPLTE